MCSGAGRLTRVPIATDQQALEFVARNEAGALARGERGSQTLVHRCARIRPAGRHFVS